MLNHGDTRSKVLRPDVYPYTSKLHVWSSRGMERRCSIGCQTVIGLGDTILDLALCPRLRRSSGGPMEMEALIVHYCISIFAQSFIAGPCAIS